MQANLYQNEDNTLYRVECIAEGSTGYVVAEKYNHSGEFIDGVKIPTELSKWGGFYCGSRYNFLVFGQNNPDEDDALEVIRVVRYTKDWERVDSCAISAVNVYIPFRAGSLRMVETNGSLFIHTCREMYASSDGLHHQSNMTLVVDVAGEKMEFLNPKNYTPAYCSHSFNQFITLDGSDVICADHGDAYPRAISVRKWTEGELSNSKYVDIYPIPGATGANATGVSLGGIEASDTGYLVAANSVDFSDPENVSFVGTRNVFVAYLDKNQLQNGAEIKWLTSNTEAVNITDPTLIKINDQSFMVIWGEGADTVKYIYVDGNGNPVGDVTTLKNTRLSDMAPIVVGGKVIWYAANNSAPVFYSIGAAECTVSFDSCGGSEVTESFRISNGMKYGDVIDKFPTPTKKGCTFAGWYTRAEGGTKVTPESTFNGMGDVVLYAHWEKAEYQVFFETGCEIEVDPITVHYGDPYGTLPDVDRYGYALSGWYTQAEGGRLITAETLYETEGDTTLYARYKEVKYIFYDANGGYFVDENQVSQGNTKRVAYGLEEIPTAVGNVVKANYLFVGWYTRAEGGTLYAFDQILTDHITLYAHYEPSRRVEAVLADVAETEELLPGTRVHLCCKTDGALIYYFADTQNLDASVIDEAYLLENGQLYDGEIQLQESVKLYALAVKQDYKASPISCYSYHILDETEFWGDILPEDRELYENVGQVPEGIWIGRVANVPYTGAAVTPSIRVYDHKTRLTAGVDYTVKYKNNKKAGAAMATVSGKGSYKGNKTATFQVLPLDIEEASFERVVYVALTGRRAKIANALTYQLNGKLIKLKAKTDYEFVCDPTLDYTAAGEYPVTIKGKGNFADSEASFRLVILPEAEKPFGNVKVNKIPDQPYTGEESKLSPELFTVKYGKTTLVYGESFEIAGYENAVEIGAATVILRGIGDYVGTKRVTFKICGTSISKALLSSNFEKQVIYTGAPVRQDEVTLVWKDGTRLNAENYVVEYQNNTNAGTATMLFQGVGEYTGTLKKTFKILPYDLKTDAATNHRIQVQVPETVTYQKGGACPEIVVTDTYGGQTHTLVYGKDYTVKYSNHNQVTVGRELAENKLPYVTVVGKGNYKGNYLPASPLRFAIGKQNLDFLPEGKVTVADVVYVRKSGNYKSKLELYDANGKKLSAGSDYQKEITYFYNEDVAVLRVEEGEEKTRLRQKGDRVDSADIVPVNTELLARISAVDSEKCPYFGKVEVSFRVVQADIAKARITIPTTVYQVGGVRFKKSDLTVRMGGETLKPEEFEIISYTANEKAGTATITIRGVGNYGGTKTQKFKISRKFF